MKDFLKGALGTLLQWILGLFGVAFLLGSFQSCSIGHSTLIGGVMIFISLLCFASIAGIRYWLGHIYRTRR